MTRLSSFHKALAVALTIGSAAAGFAGVRPLAAAAPPRSSAADSSLERIRFTPLESDSLGLESSADDHAGVSFSEDEWLRAPFGDDLLTDPDEWRSSSVRPIRSALNVDYNRVDRLRLGISLQAQRPETLGPRLGSRIEYAFGRDRVLYGVQLEQPLLPPGRLALGISAVRRTDHSELHQVDDRENSLALLFGRQDYRDYFEREGFGAYLSWRVPDFSTVSVHLRSDRYRSLPVDPGTRSWFQRDRPLRANPLVDDGTEHCVLLRLERLAHSTSRTRAGFYHWIEFERAGAGLEGDFDYERALADLRNVLRLSPGTTIAFRIVGGHTPSGTLPRQRQFTVGGVDGLRAHEFSKYRGDEMALAQAEYSIGILPARAPFLESGLHALAFVDAGRAWLNPDHVWDIGRQQIQADGGFGLGLAEDNLRVYFARDLQNPGSPFVISLRLQRPF